MFDLWIYFVHFFCPNVINNINLKDQYYLYKDRVGIRGRIGFGALQSSKKVFFRHGNVVYQTGNDWIKKCAPLNRMMMILRPGEIDRQIKTDVCSCPMYLSFRTSLVFTDRTGERN